MRTVQTGGAVGEGRTEADFVGLVGTVKHVGLIRVWEAKNEVGAVVKAVSSCWKTL